VITTNLRYVLPETPLIGAATKMRDLGVSALPVYRTLNDGSKLKLDVVISPFSRQITPS
jgi:CBS domain-containing protein